MILLLLCANKLSSQEKNYTLSTNQNGLDRNYVARDGITLNGNFQFSGDNGNHFFSAKIDPTLIFPPTQNYLTPSGQITTDCTQGGVVGSILGQFAISQTGAAIYTIPIECPLGVNGMQPTISLTYNSQGGNGLVGMGWSISGLSAITREKKIPYYDGIEENIKWDSSCPLSFDGQRLIIISSNSDSIEYRTVSETFNRIVGYNIQSWGPSYFKVYTKSEVTMTYGSPSSLASYSPLYNNAQNDALSGSNAVRSSWNLVEICDNNNNSLVSG